MVRKRFYGLKQVKVRQSWNKYNLYNLSRIKDPRVGERTYFQQKWSAKSITRGYHGETVREKQWQKMFRPTLRSVVPMDYQYLARTDGSEYALGRGSGLDVPPGQKQKPRPVTPYMNMVYGPTERRLDTAIFRALFASSTRQARQFVVHGDVKVNGKKMIYPGYMLNPGDMFQVEPERVLFATGAPKDRKERRATRVILRRSKQNAEDESAEPADPSPTATEKSSDEPQDPKEILSGLLNHAKSILSPDSKDTLSAKRKQDLRAFQRTIRKTLSRTTKSTTLTDDLDAQLMELTSKLKITIPSRSEDQQTTSDQPAPPPATLSADDRRALRAALIEARENPIDPTKTYATPWRPREFMSAFAFIPRYLEGNKQLMDYGIACAPHSAFSPSFSGSLYDTVLASLDNCISSISAAKHWNGTPIHELTNHDAHEALRKASTTGNYEMVQALLDLLVRERQEAPSPQLYLALILANTSPQHGSLEEVSKLLQEIEQSGTLLDSAMYHAVLKVLAMHPSYTFRSDVLHELLHQRWFTLSNDGWHDVVAGLIKDRQIEMALGKLEQMQAEGIRIHPWLHDMMVYILCEAEEFGEAVKIMRQRTFDGEMMISATLWYSLLDTASRALHHDATLYAWRKRVETGYLNPPSGICLNVLATASRYGDFRLATDVFRILGNRTHTFQLHHYEALIEAYVNSSDLRSALTVLCVMSAAGIFPTEASTRALFVYLRQEPPRPAKAFEILKELKDSKRDIPTPAVNCIIEACIHRDDLSQAFEHYKNLHTVCSAGPTTATFNVLLRGCSQATRKDLAMFLASEMLALGVAPDALTYDRLILVCLDADPSSDIRNTGTEYEDALRYLAEMKSMGWFPRRGTLVALVKRCSEVGDDRAWELLEEMEKRGMSIHTLETWLEKNWTGDEDAREVRRLSKIA